MQIESTSSSFTQIWQRCIFAKITDILVIVNLTILPANVKLPARTFLMVNFDMLPASVKLNVSHCVMLLYVVKPPTNVIVPFIVTSDNFLTFPANDNTPDRAFLVVRNVSPAKVKPPVNVAGRIRL